MSHLGRVLHNATLLRRAMLVRVWLCNVRCEIALLAQRGAGMTHCTRECPWNQVLGSN